MLTTLGDDDSPVKTKTFSGTLRYWEMHSRLPDVIAQAHRPKQLVFRSRMEAEIKSEVLKPVNNTVHDTADRRKRKAPADEEKQDAATSQKRIVLDSSLIAVDSSVPPNMIDPETASNNDAVKTEPKRLNVGRELTDRQDGESVEEYLTRLPPSLSDYDTHGPWLWVHNVARESRSQRDFNYDDFMEKGSKLLSDFKVLENKTRESMPGKAAGVITRKLTSKRKELEQDLRKIAKETGCLSGKWMLFPLVADIDRVWCAVCKGVDAGKLGPTAKVATNGGEVRNEREAHVRLICVYTKDFSDQKDVRRVLDALVEMNLVKLPEDDMGHGIYYKCDAYTYLNIGSGNDYKLKASIYSSKEMLKGVKWGD